jgi:hypothetical protein
MLDPTTRRGTTRADVPGDQRAPGRHRHWDAGFVRAQSSDVLPSVELFRGFHESGQLVAPEVAAAKIADKLVLGEIEQGRTYNYREL